MTGPRQAGHAVVETILMSLLLLTPLVWALGVLAELHRGALAVTAAAREAGFEAARSASVPDAERAMDDAVARALADMGVEDNRVQVSWNHTGLERGAPVAVEVSVFVPVLSAPLLGSVSDPSIRISARHIARVDPFRSRP